MRMPTEHEVFNFWKENKVSGFFQLNKEQLIEQFEWWMQHQELGWLRYYGIRECVQVFVAKGLNSIGNSENNWAEYTAMEKILKPVRLEYIEEL